jgi:hypothetical protein
MMSKLYKYINIFHIFSGKMFASIPLESIDTHNILVNCHHQYTFLGNIDMCRYPHNIQYSTSIGMSSIYCKNSLRT